MDGDQFDTIVRHTVNLTRRASLGALLAAALGWQSVAAGVEAELCLPNGQRCGRKAGGRGRRCRNCCSRYAPKVKGERHCACVPFGGKCGNRGQCCDAECNVGRCGCLDEGETCRKDSQCCFAPCIDGICRCLEDGDACTRDEECCNAFGNCVRGICQCLEDGETCIRDDDCCFTYCIGGICQCFDEGATCARDEDCCDTYCVNGICQCFPGGAACERDEECCDTPCIGGVCTWGICEAGDEVCAGGSEPFDPFCGLSDCLCFVSTGGAPFCGDWFASPDECSACEVNTDCVEVTGPGSACVVAERCCTNGGSGPATLCMPPCPEPDLERASRRSGRHAGPHAERINRRPKHRKQRRKS